MQFQFDKQNFLITGATSGIGHETAKALLEAGANVLGIGRDASKAQGLTSGFPESFTFLACDLSQPFQIEADLSAFITTHGKFNGMLNCAGREETLPITLYNPEKIRALFDLNFHAPFEILRLLSKKKYSEDAASFVFMSSVMGELGQPGKTGYCATKAALLGLVKASALELAPRKIRVNAVCPGVVDTPMTQNLFGQITEDGKAAIEKMHPLGIGQTTDIVPLLLFLLSDGSRWITGQSIKPDGGYSIL